LLAIIPIDQLLFIQILLLDAFCQNVLLFFFFLLISGLPLSSQVPVVKFLGAYTSLLQLFLHLVTEDRLIERELLTDLFLTLALRILAELLPLALPGSG